MPETLETRVYLTFPLELWSDFEFLSLEQSAVVCVVSCRVVSCRVERSPCRVSEETFEQTNRQNPLAKRDDALCAPLRVPSRLAVLYLAVARSRRWPTLPRRARREKRKEEEEKGEK